MAGHRVHALVQGSSQYGSYCSAGSQETLHWVFTFPQTDNWIPDDRKHRALNTVKRHQNGLWGQCSRYKWMAVGSLQNIAVVAGCWAALMGLYAPKATHCPIQYIHISPCACILMLSYNIINSLRFMCEVPDAITEDGVSGKASLQPLSQNTLKGKHSTLYLYTHLSSTTFLFSLLSPFPLFPRDLRAVPIGCLEPQLN